VAEFDAPAKLLADPNSIFSSMVDETGPTNARLLREMASKRLPPTAVSNSTAATTTIAAADHKSPDIPPSSASAVGAALSMPAASK
jgi:hypothetical protein